MPFAETPNRDGEWMTVYAARNTDRDLIREGHYPDFGSYRNSSRRMICDWCRESDESHASTVVRFEAFGGWDRVRVGDYLVHYSETPDGGFDSEAPAWFDRIWPRGGRSYKHTDGWRGYYDTNLKGLHKVTEGWVTGYPDSTVSYKMTSAEVYKRLTNAEPGEGAPVDTYWLFEPTSNVFSTACTVYTRNKRDARKFAKWLAEEAGTSEEAFDRAFG